MSAGGSQGTAAAGAAPIEPRRIVVELREFIIAGAHYCPWSRQIASKDLEVSIGDRRRPTLTEAAQRHANDMLEHGVNGHIGSAPTAVRSSSGALDPLRIRAKRWTCGCKVRHPARSS
jgi:hypothetical protein